MSAVPRLLAAARLAAVIGMSGSGVVALHRLGGRPYFQVDWGDLGGWLEVTAAEDVLVAGVRVLALLVAWWVLGSTLLYVAARASHLPGALRAVQWAALPAVRRLADRAVAVTLAGSSVLGAAGPAAAADRDPPAVMPTAVVVQVDERDDDKDADGIPEAEGYVPVPAGDDPPGAGEGSSSEGPGFRLPMPEAPAPVSPPPATALPPEPEHGEEDTEPSGIGGEVGLGAGSRRALAGTQTPDGQSSTAVVDEGSAGRGGGDPATGAATEARSRDGERERPASPDTYTVTAGDHLWGIAERTLTAAWGRPPSPGELVGYWRQLIAANTGRLASGDPDLIFPGEVIDLPAIPPIEE